MTLSLGAGFLWLVAANLIGMFPSKDYHWTNAYILIALGLPVLGWITWTNGPLWGLVFLMGGASVLRWPVVYLWRWVKGLVRKLLNYHE